MSGLQSTLITVGVFIGMLLSIELGRKAGRRWLAKDPKHGREGLSTIEAAVFALMGLMIAFSFSGAAGRFDARRNQIATEANAIGTAWLRLDTLPEENQGALRSAFREYTDSRIRTFRLIGDEPELAQEMMHSARLQKDIWTSSVQACQASSSPLLMNIMLPALNQMFDMATARNAMANIHPPLVIFGMLSILMLLCSFLAGYAMGGGRIRNYSHILGFAIMLAAVFYVILDLEYPRAGLIRIDSADAVMLNQRRSMD